MLTNAWNCMEGCKGMEELDYTVSQLERYYRESQTDCHICASTPIPSSTDSQNSTILHGMNYDYLKLLMFLPYYRN